MSARRSIGERARCFTLEVPQDAPDGFGGHIRSYQPGPRLWGAIALIAAGERRRADRPEAVATHRVTLPYRAGLAADQRLVLGMRRFRIKSADDPDGARRSIVCLVEEIAA